MASAPTTTAAVLQIGDAEYPFTRVLFGWRAGDENVSFAGDGKCVFRGRNHLVSEYTLWLPRATIELLRTNDPLVPMPLKNVNVKPIEDRPTPYGAGLLFTNVDAAFAAVEAMRGATTTAKGTTGVFEVLKDGYLNEREYEFKDDGQFHVGPHTVTFAHNGACHFDALNTFLFKTEYVLWVPKKFIDLLRSTSTWENVTVKPIEDRPVPTAATTDFAARIVQLQKDHDVHVTMFNEDLTRLTGRIAELEEKLNDVTRKMDQTSDDAPVIV